MFVFQISFPFFMSNPASIIFLWRTMEKAHFYWIVGTKKKSLRSFKNDIIAEGPK